MQSVNTLFCRKLLSSIMPEVKQYLTPETLKYVWVYGSKHKGKNSLYEFHINACEQYPNGYFTCFSASNAYDAKYQGFMQLIKNLSGYYVDAE